MSAWCEDKGFEGAATFLRQHAVEERQHMERLFTYVSETGAMPVLGAIEAPPHEFKSLGDIFRTTLEHEYHITKCINGLAHVAFTTQDYSTFNFLQWYVAEQHEEEKLFKSRNGFNEAKGTFNILNFFSAWENHAPYVEILQRELNLVIESLPA
jgi:ferritin